MEKVTKKQEENKNKQITKKHELCTVEEVHYWISHSESHTAYLVFYVRTGSILNMPKIIYNNKYKKFNTICITL